MILFVEISCQWEKQEKDSAVWYVKEKWKQILQRQKKVIRSLGCISKQEMKKRVGKFCQQSVEAGIAWPSDVTESSTNRKTFTPALHLKFLMWCLNHSHLLCFKKMLRQNSWGISNKHGAILWIISNPFFFFAFIVSLSPLWRKALNWHLPTLANGVRPPAAWPLIAGFELWLLWPLQMASVTNQERLNWARSRCTLGVGDSAWSRRKA